MNTLVNREKIKNFASKKKLVQEEVDRAFLRISNHPLEVLVQDMKLFMETLKDYDNPLPSSDSFKKTIYSENAHFVKYHNKRLRVMEEYGYEPPVDEQFYKNYFSLLQTNSSSVYDLTFKMFEEFNIPVPSIDWLESLKNHVRTGYHLCGSHKTPRIGDLTNYLKTLNKHDLIKISEENMKYFAGLLEKYSEITNQVQEYLNLIFEIPSEISKKSLESKINDIIERKF